MAKETKVFKVATLLNSLSLRDQDILIRRYILNENLEKIGEKYNMTNERVRQVQEKAIKLIEDTI